MTERDGWIATRFKIAMSKPGTSDVLGHREDVDGETWGPFGLDRLTNSPHWIVTHLPTGFQMATFERKTDAKRFCRRIARLTDWATVEPPVTGDLQAGVLAARERCDGVRLIRFGP